jgi:hypothetical protein
MRMLSHNSMRHWPRTGVPVATLLVVATGCRGARAASGQSGSGAAHFEDARSMTAANTTDPGLLASYADFLLDQGEYRQAQALLAPYQRQDSLLLRLTLAERALGLAGDAAAAAAADEHARRLELRFQEMRERGDKSHLREQAMFELGIRGDAPRALQLIEQSWVFLREPIDARLYLRRRRRQSDAVAGARMAAQIRPADALVPELAAAQSSRPRAEGRLAPCSLDRKRVRAQGEYPSVTAHQRHGSAQAILFARSLYVLALDTDGDAQLTREGGAGGSRRSPIQLRRPRCAPIRTIVAGREPADRGSQRRPLREPCA